MAITQKSIKLLWSAAAGRCSFPGCWERLTYHEAGAAAPHTLGEMAHIRGENVGSNRHDPSQSPAERDDYQNLILLCPNHHSRIDRKENEATFPVALLEEYKSEHERAILERLDRNPDAEMNDVVKQVVLLLDENRTSWQHYGPLSELAQRDPYNEAAHAVWISERLSVIIPNNRKIAEIMGRYRDLFNMEAQPIISKFLLHTRSYERWVQDEIPYAAVARFPTDFDELMRDMLNDSLQQ